MFVSLVKNLRFALHFRKSYIFVQKMFWRSVQLSLGAKRAANFLCTGMTQNREKNTSITLVKI
jgi:hypothetical protein